MALRRLPAFTALTATTIAVACSHGGTGSGAPAQPAAEWSKAAVEAWRQKHDVDYRRDYVSIAGLHALRPGPNPAGSASTNAIVLPAGTPPRVGRFVLEGETVRFEPADGLAFRLKRTRPNTADVEEPLTGPTVLKDDATAGVDEILIGDVRLVVHVSGTSRSIRVRDPHGPLATGFLGFTWFDIDPAFHVVGRFIPDPAPRQVRVPNTYGDIDEYTTEGVVEFAWQGQMLRLRPFTTRPKRLYFVFRDASSGHETYAAARFLYADLSDDGRVSLDFNMAYNPPCSFNPFTTCPIPLPENRLPAKILAGEKAYPVHVPLPNEGAAP